jgi:hypothetical protein
MIFTYVTKIGKDGEPVIPDFAKQFIKEIKPLQDGVEVNCEIPDEKYNELLPKLLEMPSDIYDINPPISAPVSTGKTAISTGSTI